MMPYSHLQLDERKAIKKMRIEKKSFRQIGAILGRNPSTISREFRRNSGQHWYRPIDAHRISIERRKSGKISKIERNQDLKDYILKKLESRQSPDSIAGRLKITYGKNTLMRISHESIYRWIYKDAQSGGEIYKNLIRSIRKRHKRLNKYINRLQIPDRVSIHQRPWSANTGRHKGHWEGDTIFGANNSGYIATLVDRKSLFLVAGFMKNKKSETCNRAIFEAFSEICNKEIKTITFDNGTEFYHYKDLSEAFECKIYFADPYVLGSVEKMSKSMVCYAGTFRKKWIFLK